MVKGPRPGQSQYRIFSEHSEWFRGHVMQKEPVSGDIREKREV